MHIVKEFQVLLINTDISIQHYSFICTQLNGFMFCYVSLTIQLKHLSIVYTQFKCQTVLFDQ